MGMILALLLGIIIIYRIYLIEKAIKQLIFSGKFWIGSVVFAIYFKICRGLFFFIGHNIIKKIFNQLDFVDIPFLISLPFVFLYFACQGAVIGLFIYAYYKASKRHPFLILPAYFILLIFSFGMVALKLYNLNGPGSNNGKEFVDHHHVGGYNRADNTHVNGYWRDGDGDPSMDLSKEDGGGYYRSK